MSRPYRTDCAFKLGLLTILVDLMTVKVTGASKSLFNNVCPDCEEATKVSEQLVCPVGHGPFTQGQLNKARQTGKDTYVKMTEEDLALVNGSFPTKIFDMKVCSAESFDGRTLPGSVTYRVRPTSKNPDNDGYQLLKSLVENSEHVFYGRLKMSENAFPGAYKLSIWNGQIILQSFIPPEVLDSVDDIAGQVNLKYLEMANNLVNQMEVPFDETYVMDYRIDKINQILDSKDSGRDIQVVDSVPSSNLLDMLAASLEAIK